MEKKKDYTEGKWFSDDKGYIWRRDPKDLYQNGGGVAGDMPVAVCDRGWYGDSEGYPEAGNARRIVACVNACAGIDTEWLENNGAYAVPVPSLRTLLNQRDELLAALKAAEALRRKGLINSEPGEMERVDSMRREAIAKCEVQS